MTVICLSLLLLKDPSTVTEIMKMFEIHIVEVITKSDSPCLPYLGVIKMLQSVYGCDNKNNVN